MTTIESGNQRNEAYVRFLQTHQQRVNDCLTKHLRDFHSAFPPLGEAMEYSLMAKGKRLRPVLVYAAAQAVSEVNDAVDVVACAVECTHTYSLIHDDLPAMDNDDLRRGVPTCHIAYNEATAILAGDALLTLAFQWLSQCETLAPQTRLDLIENLSKAAGWRGMVGGQMLDLNAVGKPLTLPELEQLHRLKTGALIKASVEMGAIATEAASPKQLQALGEFAANVGLAFQIQDDILDVDSSTEELGKSQGADAKLGKPTYVSVAGLQGARELAAQQTDAAIAALAGFDHRADPLRELAYYTVSRKF